MTSVTWLNAVWNFRVRDRCGVIDIPGGKLACDGIFDIAGRPLACYCSRCRRPEAELGIRIAERLELFLYRQASVVVALTQSFKNDLMQRGIPGEKIEVVLNGVDLPRYKPQPREATLAREWNLGSEDFVMGYIGTLGLSHGLESVLEAAELVRDSPVKILFVGIGAARNMLMEGARNRHLTNIVSVPPQPKERTPAFWSLCNAALVHLKDDPVFATVIRSKIFESMAMGLPIVLAAPQGEASSILRSTGTGIHVPSGDPKALADAMLLLARHPSLCTQFAEKSLLSATTVVNGKLRTCWL